MTSGRWGGTFAALALAAGSCGDDETAPVEKAPTVLMDYAAKGFFDAPFPSDVRRDAAGRPVVAGFPNPNGVFLVDEVLEVLARDADGFGVSSGAFLRTDSAVDPSSLPTLAGSLEAGASVQLLGVDASSPDYLVRTPVRVSFDDDPGPFGAPNLLSIVPLQGAPLRANTRYAVVITRALRDTRGRAFGSSVAVQQLRDGGVPEGWTAEQAEQQRAFPALEAAGIPAGEVVALSVFTTGDPVTGMGRLIEEARANALPAPNEAFTKTDDFPTFCVYAATIDMPVYQTGEPPYAADGGGFELDEAGVPLLDRAERARFVLTVPKTPMPSGGYPLVVFSRTGGGGDRPLVDRGVRAEPGGEAVEPGSGPALEFARVGFAGASVDGPHGGLRNVTGGDEQLLVFNFQNPLALRDNVRQSALELALLPSILDDVTVDVSDCLGAEAPMATARFDARAVMGHSMGASIAPLALVFEPRFEAMVLSGAGGSFLENVLHKQKPLAVKPLAELILELAGTKHPLVEGTPLLSMLQWAGEPADSPVYGRHVIREPLAGAPRHVLMMQGIVDRYILPPIANAASLAFGLELAGKELDEEVAELEPFEPLGELLALRGGAATPLPASLNVESVDGEPATAVVTQHAEDGVEDGHEVVFQTAVPKHAYACFLASLSSGAPLVPSPANPGAPCE
jgi:hypothetical protein